MSGMEGDKCTVLLFKKSKYDLLFNVLLKGFPFLHHLVFFNSCNIRKLLKNTKTKSIPIMGQWYDFVTCLHSQCSGYQLTGTVLRSETNRKFKWFPKPLQLFPNICETWKRSSAGLRKLKLVWKWFKCRSDRIFQISKAINLPKTAKLSLQCAEHGWCDFTCTFSLVCCDQNGT